MRKINYHKKCEREREKERLTIEAISAVCFKEIICFEADIIQELYNDGNFCNACNDTDFLPLFAYLIVPPCLFLCLPVLCQLVLKIRSFYYRTMQGRRLFAHGTLQCIPTRNGEFPNEARNMRFKYDACYRKWRKDVERIFIRKKNHTKEVIPK